MKKNHTKSALIITLILVLTLFICSCASSKARLLEYQSLDFAAEICGMINSVDFSAKLTVTHVPGSSEKIFELQLTSPETLSGITFRSESNGGLTASLDGLTLTLPDTDTSGAMIILRMFSITEDPIDISVVDELTRVDFPSVTIYIDPSTSRPTRLVSKNADVTVLSFHAIN